VELVEGTTTSSSMEDSDSSPFEGETTLAGPSTLRFSGPSSSTRYGP
jgi:hypothetical protein